jgi:hypothetical protein
MDAFLLLALQQKGLTFSPEADRRTWLRRVTFDLTGLPPTPEEQETFVRDKSPTAHETVVDRLLASPRYGERWGRHWLDVVRYTDSLDARGIGGEGDISEAWRYRDWVIGAFNADMPYDQFIRWQVAGDILGNPVPTGFLAIGNWGNGDADKDKILTDIADDQVDTTCRAFLGLTVGCARCHDHKFDPITQKDYYALAGIFFSTHILPHMAPKSQGEVFLHIPLDTPAQTEVRERLAALETTITSERNTARKAVAKQRTEEIANGKQLDPVTDPLWREFLGVDGPPRLRHRFQNLGDIVGVEGVRGDRDALSATVNTTAKAQKISTFTLPARSLNVHPSPNFGVAALWRAPLSGKVTIEATLSDADPACGDGFVWELRHGEAVLDKGTVPNGGHITCPKREVTVQEGESLLLCVLPGRDYTCDTTTMTWNIRADDGTAWDITTDALAHAGQGAFGPWRFVDLAPPQPTLEVKAVIAAWNAGDRGTVAKLVEALPPEQNPLLPDTDEELPADVRTRLATLEAQRITLQKQVPAMPEMAIGAAEGGVPGSPHEGIHDVRIHHRGRYDSLGELVPRGVPAVIAGEKPFTIASGSGRKELADWLASPTNPLTARVIVNRVWQGHFGRGIVGTPSNFGVLGEKPTHRELLDWLAWTFVHDDNWSLKKLHRRIVLSQAYRQSSIPSPVALARDPDNRLLSRMPRRRLEAEAFRDSLLFVTGKLDVTPGGVAYRDFNLPRRTVYAMTIRSDRTGFGPLFDSADPTISVERRTVSTVAPQALFLLNSPFLLGQSRTLAERLKQHPGSDAERIDFSYRLLYARLPSSQERQLGLAFLAQEGTDGWDAYAQVLLCANEFCYVD